MISDGRCWERGNLSRQDASYREWLLPDGFGKDQIWVGPVSGLVTVSQRPGMNEWGGAPLGRTGARHRRRMTILPGTRHLGWWSCNPSRCANSLSRRRTRQGLGRLAARLVPVYSVVACSDPIYFGGVCIICIALL